MSIRRRTDWSCSSIDEAVRVTITYRENLLLAELVGAALYHEAASRVTGANVGRRWGEVMEAEGLDFATADL